MREVRACAPRTGARARGVGAHIEFSSFEKTLMYTRIEIQHQVPVLHICGQPKSDRRRSGHDLKMNISVEDIEIHRMMGQHQNFCPFTYCAVSATSHLAQTRISNAMCEMGVRVCVCVGVGVQFRATVTAECEWLVTHLYHPDCCALLMISPLSAALYRFTLILKY